MNHAAREGEREEARAFKPEPHTVGKPDENLILALRVLNHLDFADVATKLEDEVDAITSKLRQHILAPLISAGLCHADGTAMDGLPRTADGVVITLGMTVYVFVEGDYDEWAGRSWPSGWAPEEVRTIIISKGEVTVCGESEWDASKCYSTQAERGVGRESSRHHRGPKPVHQARRGAEDGSRGLGNAPQQARDGDRRS